MADDGHALGDELERPSLQLTTLFVAEVALAERWRARGMEPQALLGHSVGELSAACIAERDER